MFGSPESAVGSMLPAAGGKANVAGVEMFIDRRADGAEAFRVARLTLRKPIKGGYCISLPPAEPPAALTGV